MHMELTGKLYFHSGIHMLTAKCHFSPTHGLTDNPLVVAGLQDESIALGFFPLFFTLSYYKMIANGHVDLWKRTVIF